MIDTSTIFKTRKPFFGALKQYSKCYRIICHFKPHYLHIYTNMISPLFCFRAYEISISHLNSHDIWKYFLLKCYKLLPLNWAVFPWQPVCIKYEWYYISWYSNCEGGNDSLKIIIYLKYDTDCILNPYSIPLELNTDIFYAYVSATHFLPLSPLNEKKYIWSIKPTLYRMVYSYCIISLSLYFITSGIVFVFIYF